MKEKNPILSESKKLEFRPIDFITLVILPLIALAVQWSILFWTWEKFQEKNFPSDVTSCISIWMTALFSLYWAIFGTRFELYNRSWVWHPQFWWSVSLILCFGILMMPLFYRCFEVWNWWKWVLVLVGGPFLFSILVVWIVARCKKSK